jgi:hypothetical protein
LLTQSFGFDCEKREKESLWDAEIRRRRFWAYYLTNSHASEPSNMMLTEPSPRAKRLTLPWREEDYELGIPTILRPCLESEQTHGGLYCELIKAMTYW